MLEQLTPAHLTPLLSRALSDVERGLGSSEVEVPPEVLAALGQVAGGDARAALNALELAVSSALAADGAGAGAAKQEQQGGDDGGGGGSEQQQQRRCVVTVELVERALQKTHLLYDRGGDEHYNMISALHKSMRGGDPDAALYWSGRMLAGGEDPRSKPSLHSISLHTHLHNHFEFGLRFTIIFDSTARIWTD